MRWLPPWLAAAVLSSISCSRDTGNLATCDACSAHDAFAYDAIAGVPDAPSEADSGLHPIAPDVGQVDPDTGPADTIDFGATCRSAHDCHAGEVCLFWTGGCSSGVCAAMCPLVDAGLADGAQGARCDCNGNTFSGCSDRPWSHEGACVQGTDALPPDSHDIGAACMSAHDCTPGEVCLFWTAGCTTPGVCAAMCPIDQDAIACDGVCNPKCDCKGNTFGGCADRPWSHGGFCTVDAGPAEADVESGQ